MNTVRQTSYLFALLVGLVFWGAGCPDGTESAGPVDECSSVGEQCRLEGGQLGVCTMNVNGELECLSQH